MGRSASRSRKIAAAPPAARHPLVSGGSAGKPLPGRHASPAVRPAGRGGRPRMVPTRWLKLVAGVLLLPVSWVLSRTFFEEFTRATVTLHFWRTEEFYFFMLGGVVWLIAFVGLPRLLIVYVFGHELTHAIWVLAQGGEVTAFEVRRDGGFIIADRRNFIVSLAPYFFPIYSIALVGFYGVAGLFYPQVWLYHRWLCGLLGATWAFHLSFTCWMIPKQQTDLLLHGTFFSLTVIYLANLVILSALLIAACPQVTWAHFAVELRHNATGFSAWVLHGMTNDE
jgi:hypothetical protein